MAIKLIDQYPGRVNPATSDYPYGSIKNETVPDANDGTPLDQAWGNNIEGFLQALLVAAGIAPNGVIEKAGASQYLQAIQSLMDAGLAGKSNNGHGHVIGDISGLQAALNGKLSATGKAVDADKLDGLDSAAFLKKSEFNPAALRTVWSGSAKRVFMSSFPENEQGPGIYILHALDNRQYSVTVSLTNRQAAGTVDVMSADDTEFRIKASGYGASDGFFIIDATHRHGSTVEPTLEYITNVYKA